MRNYFLSFCLLIASIHGSAQYQVPITGATASQPSETGYELTKAFDNDNNTMYHTKWYQNGIPEVLTFNFSNITNINRLTYQPRTDGSTNGIWTKIEVLYSTPNNPGVFTSIGTYNLAGTAEIKTINFDNGGINNPQSIRIRVIAGIGDFSSAGEIKFYAPTAPPLYAIYPSSATASQPAEPGYDISKAIDDNDNTMYHTKWYQNGIPEVLTFNFTNTASINRITYKPRFDGASNGIWTQIEVLYSTASNPNAFISKGTYNLAQNSDTKTIDFDNGGIVNPSSIRIKVIAGAGNFSSAQEIRFYSSTQATLYQVSASNASSSQTTEPGYEITKAIDGDTNSLYHTKFYQNGIPETLTFNFVNVASIERISYLPRNDASNNGTWSQIEVLYSTIADPGNFISKGTYNLNLNSDLKTINFSNGSINNPSAIKIKVLAGAGDFSSAREIRFYSLSPQNIPPCDITAADINSAEDYKNTIISATVNSAQNGQGIERSYDGDMSTIYHSNYSSILPNTPIDIDYTLGNNSVVDYILYTPRQDGATNGNFGNITVFYKATSTSGFVELMNYNTEFSNTPSRLTLPQRLNNPYQIRIRVSTGSGNFAACAEMEFYKNNGNTNLFTNIFSDQYYNTLKTGITQNDINSISNGFYKSLASCIYNGTYDRRYRTQEYVPYRIVSNLSSSLKISTYNSFENPTGIYFRTGEKAVLFVGPEAANFRVALKIVDMRTRDNYYITNYSLKPGLNVIDIAREGLSYIDYYTDNTNAPQIKINIVTGLINGCFDPSIDSEQQWSKILDNNVYEHVDIKGKYVNLLFDKAKLKQYSPNNGTEFIAAFDKIVRTQHEIMGLVKHNKAPKNHMFAYAHSGGGLYAASYGAHFDYNWGPGTFVSLDGVTNVDIWGVAHEFGHINQVRPGFNWVGQGDVTNNVYSAFSQYTTWAGKYKYTRLESDPTESRDGETPIVAGRFNGFLDKAILNQKNIIDNDRLLPIWQLQLYYQFAGSLKGLPTLEQRINGTPAPASGPDPAHWIGDMLEVVRNTNQTGLTHGELVLNFIKNTCDAVGEDLTDFFTAVGYLRPIDRFVTDYGSAQYTITQAQIDATIASIKAKNYPAPVSPVIHYLSAFSLNTFKNKLKAEGVAGVGVQLNQAQRLLVVDHSKWKNVVAFETYDASNNLLRINVAGSRDLNNSTTTIEYPTNANRVYAVSYDGSKKLVYPANATASAISSYNPIDAGNNNDGEFILSPNPSDGFVNIMYPASVSNINNIKIFDVNGNAKNVTISNQWPSIQLNVSALSPGIYTLQFLADGKTINKKLIKR